MPQAFDREALLDAFDRIGMAAAAAKTRLQFAVYGRSALMLTSNFRFATEGVDIAEIDGDWPNWLTLVVAQIAREKGWGEDWPNEAVSFHLRPPAQTGRDHFASLAQDMASRAAMLHDAPLLAETRHDALMGAVAEYLANDFALPNIPKWAFDGSRYLDHAWHATPFDDDGMGEYFTFSSPAEFASRNIFTEARPLRRARGLAPCKPDIV